ncbi:MAG: roadblock/LC7 domain-containing protein [Methanomassiliicoccales archaeon]|jgi:predicted regulator of Ras-like GTPase activity (Roadblock/LC7/MglB family)
MTSGFSKNEKVIEKLFMLPLQLYPLQTLRSVWVQMGELSQIRNVLEDIKNLEHVKDVSLISRGGMYISGDPPKGVHQETFAAMSAIILGAAETTSAELKDNFNRVVLQLAGRNLILTGAGPRYLLVVATDAEGDVGKISTEAKEKISKVEMTL